MIPGAELAAALRDHLPRQRWFSGRGGGPVDVDVERVDVIRAGLPGLVRVLASVPADGARATYQLVCGLRPPEQPEPFLEGRPEALIGHFETAEGPVLAYDAVIDPELAVALLEHVAPGEHAERARPLTGEQSNSSVIFDERLIMKLFRRLADGPNPDAEVTRALADAGFTHVAPPVGEWREDDTHYAVVNEFLVGGTEGFALALTSLRDLYDARVDPAEAGGDFAPESGRLGRLTAEMHVALARALGVTDADPSAWAADMDAQLARVDGPDLPIEHIAAVYERVRHLDDPGPAIRVHGDYHLGQVMRTDSGWFVLDFEGEPARPLEERRRPSSALRDVAGMLRSFHYAAEVALREWGETDDELTALALAWEERNAAAFLHGYWSTKGVDDVVPGAEGARQLVLEAFLLDKAVYEVGYERSHRPDWVGIPLSAVRRLLEPLP